MFPPRPYLQGRHLREHLRSPTRILMTSLINCLMILKRKSPNHSNDQKLPIMNHPCGLLGVKKIFTRQTTQTCSTRVARHLKVSSTRGNHKKIFRKERCIFLESMPSRVARCPLYRKRLQQSTTILATKGNNNKSSHQITLDLKPGLLTT